MASLVMLVGTVLRTHIGLTNNLLENPEFEVPGLGPRAPARGWVGNTSVFVRSPAGLRYDGQAGATAPQCIQYVPRRREADNNPCWCSQSVPTATPGGRYRITAMLRGVGGGVMVQWTKAKNWFGGSYPTYINQGSQPPPAPETWRTISQVFVVPLDADPGGVFVSVFDGYMRPTPNVTAEFKNVSLVQVPPDPLRVMVRSPSYRGLVTETGPDVLELLAWIHLESAPFLEARVRTIESNTSLSTTGISWPPTGGVMVPIRFREDPRVLLQSAGIYVVDVRVIDPQADNITIASSQHTLRRLAGILQPRVILDSAQRLVVEGKRMFPIGLYFQATQINETTMLEVGKSNFNCIMPYDSGLNLTATRNGLDLAHSHGVRVLVDVDMGVNNFPMGTAAAKERIAKLRNHPAVIGWYTSDERGLDYLPVLRDLHSFASTEDIDHPTWSVFTGGQVADLEDFVEVFDVAGTDPYPIGIGPGVNASLAREFADYTLSGVAQTRGVWQVIQAFNHNNTRLPMWPSDGLFRTPSLDEMRSMIWQSICAGANGVFLYSFFESYRDHDVDFNTQWGRMQRVAAEVANQSEILLRESAPAPEAPTGTSAWWRMTRSHWVDKEKGIYMLYVVSDGKGGGETEFVLPWSIDYVEVLAPGSSSLTRRIHPPSNRTSSFVDVVAPLGIAVYRVTLKNVLKP